MSGARGRADVWAPRAGSVSAAVDLTVPMEAERWTWRARMRVRSEEATLGLFMDAGVTADALGARWRLRIGHAAAAPAWTAVGLGSGLVRPVHLGAGQRLASLDLRRGAWTVRAYEVLAGAGSTHRGVSLSFDRRAR